MDCSFSLLNASLSFFFEHDSGSIVSLFSDKPLAGASPPLLLSLILKLFVEVLGRQSPFYQARHAGALPMPRWRWPAVPSLPRSSRTGIPVDRVHYIFGPGDYETCRQMHLCVMFVSGRKRQCDVGMPKVDTVVCFTPADKLSLCFAKLPEPMPLFCRGSMLIFLPAEIAVCMIFAFCAGFPAPV